MTVIGLARLVELASSVTGRTGLIDAAGGPGGAVVAASEPCDADPALLTTLPLVIVGLAPTSAVRSPAVRQRTGGGEGAALDPADVPGADLVDVVAADDAEADRLVVAVGAHPLAASTLAVLLRSTHRRAVGDGLVAESTAYSALQAGPEHRRWLAARGPARRRPPDDRPRVAVRRQGDVVRITLTRPAVRNAYDAAMREALLDATAVAEADPAAPVVLDGEGPAFCSGGDLDEFGTLADPASAHLVRVGRSVGYALHLLADRLTANVHGTCVGSGVELAAFAGRVAATPDTTFRLPEVAMGLVPGAGGTVSVPRRIGRHRTAWLALTRQAVDATTAQAWGLVDEVVALRATAPG